MEKAVCIVEGKFLTGQGFCMINDGVHGCWRRYLRPVGAGSDRLSASFLVQGGRVELVKRHWIPGPKLGGLIDFEHASKSTHWSLSGGQCARSTVFCGREAARPLGRVLGGCGLVHFGFGG